MLWDVVFPPFAAAAYAGESSEEWKDFGSEEYASLCGYLYKSLLQDQPAAVFYRHHQSHCLLLNAC